MTPAPSLTSARAPRGLRHLVATVAAVAVVVTSLSGCGGSDAPQLAGAGSERRPDFSYTIPEGTGELVDRGEATEVLPERLEARVGQTIQIVNEDSRGHVVGPFFVEAGTTLRQTFASPGLLEGTCSAHVSGRFVLEVHP